MSFKTCMTIFILCYTHIFFFFKLDFFLKNYLPCGKTLCIQIIWDTPPNNYNFLRLTQIKICRKIIEHFLNYPFNVSMHV